MSDGRRNLPDGAAGGTEVPVLRIPCRLQGGPVWSIDGRLTAFQIRLDVPYQKRKYIWLSSAKLNKGCSPGSPVSLSGTSDAQKVFVTEGILKAEITHQRTGETYIGNPGVMSHKELKQMLIQLKEQGLREVVEANDMDKLTCLDCREGLWNHMQDMQRKRPGMPEKEGKAGADPQRKPQAL